MSLSDVQKAAGRVFLAAQQACLDALQPASRCSPFIREFRHACPRAGGASVAVQLRERSRPSPCYHVHPDGTVYEHDGPGSPGPLAPGSTAVPPGFFTFCWADGKCACGLRVRSSGHIVLTESLISGG